jgi:serine/threonine-protein kinase RsbT
MGAPPTTIYLQTESDVTTALITAGDLAVSAGFDDRGKNGIMTVVAELARNVIKYAKSGRVILTPIDRAGRRGIEIEVVDRGPGIADLDQAMTDHFSTGKTLGLGLPGAKRLMDEFTITSTPGRGTRVVARKWL